MRKTLIVTLLTVCLAAVGCATHPSPKDVIYVGTFSGRGSQGLYVFELDRKTGDLSAVQSVDDRDGPNFQALHPNGRFLYSVSGDAFSEGSDHGTITAYRINSETGAVSMINERSVEGRGPAHVSIHPQGRFAFVSNYGSGNLSVFALDEDGSLSEVVDVVQHEGQSVNEQRQGGPHVHSIIPSDDGRFIYASDLGTDEIMIYAVDQRTGDVRPAEVPNVESTPGAGPRHFVIHPKGEYAYSAEELTSTVAAYNVDESTGALTPFQRVGMLPEDFKDLNSAADIHVAPDGRFLYASNRGHNSLAIFEIDESNGELSLVGHEPTRGGHPRNFMIDRKGEFILVANRDNDNVVVFRRDASTGRLQFLNEAHIPMAVCVTQNPSD